MTPPAGELTNNAKHALSLVSQAGGLHPRYTAENNLVWWTDPETKSTLVMKLERITLDSVVRHMACSRAKFRAPVEACL